MLDNIMELLEDKLGIVIARIIAVIFVGLLIVGMFTGLGWCLVKLSTYEVDAGIITSKCYSSASDIWETTTRDNTTTTKHYHNDEKFCFNISGKDKEGRDGTATKYVPQDLWNQANVGDWFDSNSYKIRKN